MDLSDVDHLVFHRYSAAGRICLIVYVDEVVTSSDHYGKSISLTSFSNKTNFIAYQIEIARYKNDIAISQREKTTDILEDPRIINDNRADTHMELKTKLLPS